MPPYRRKGYKRSYGRSRSTSRRRRPMGGSFMKRAKTRAFANLRTGGLLAIERKFSDFGTAEVVLACPAVIGASGTGLTPWAPAQIVPTVYRSAVGVSTYPVAPVALNVLGPGDTGSDRDGRQVINDSIHIRGYCGYSNIAIASIDAATVVNFVVVLDTQTNGAGPGSGANIFVAPGATDANSGRSAAGGPFVNLSNSKRFRILKHIRRVLTPSAFVPGAANVGFPQGGFSFACDIPLKQMKTNYVADTPVTTATVASIGDNGIFTYAWIDDFNLSGSSNVFMTYNSRLRFRG